MTRPIMLTRRFARHLKRLQSDASADVLDAINTIASDPQVADVNFVDLATLRVHRFYCAGQPFLLGYTLADDIRLIHLEAAGVQAESVAT